MLSVFVRSLIVNLIAWLVIPTATFAQSQELAELNSQVLRLSKIGRYAQALPLAERAVEIAKNEYGEKSSQRIRTLSTVGNIYQRLSMHSSARSAFQQLLDIEESLLGSNHPQLTVTLHNLARAQVSTQKFSDAERSYNRRLDILRSAFPSESPRRIVLVMALLDLAGFYTSQHRTSDARVLLTEANLALDSPTIHDKSQRWTISMGLAQLGENVEKHYRRAIAASELLRVKPNDRRKAEVAARTGLAQYYASVARHADAEQEFKSSLQIARQLKSSDPILIENILVGLAGLELTKRNFINAEKLFRRAIKLSLQRSTGRGNIGTAAQLHQLGMLLQALGRNREAIKELQSSLDITAHIRGKNHYSYAATLATLAKVHFGDKNFDKAERLFTQALSIRAQAFGKNDSWVGVISGSLARLYAIRGDFGKAEVAASRSLEIASIGGKHTHPYAEALGNAAAIQYRQSKWRRASDDLRELTKTLTVRFKRSAGARQSVIAGYETSPENGPFLAYVKSAYRSFASQSAAPDTFLSSAFEAAQTALASQAAMALSRMASRQAVNNPALSQLVRTRQDLVAEWSKQDRMNTLHIAQGSQNNDPSSRAKNRARLASIDARISLIDKELQSEFPNFLELANPSSLHISEVRARLKSNEALAVILDTPAFNPTPEETFIWVVTKTKSRWVRSGLGSKALKDHVDALRCGLDYQGAWGTKTPSLRCLDLLKTSYSQDDLWSGKPLPFSLQRAHTVYKELFGQIEDLIEGKDLLIVPSGPLTQLPFHVLVTEKPDQEDVTREVFTKTAWLGQRHAITVLPSVSSLQVLRAHAKTSRATKPFFGVGNPLLDGDGSYQAEARQARAIAGCAASQAIRTASLRRVRSSVVPMGGGAGIADLDHLRRQSPLPETADELCAVARVVGASIDDVLLGQQATETTLKSLSSSGRLAAYKVIHFATHGALAGELQGAAEPGLILTPPQKSTGYDDGYLSASEIAGLKLDADWVILSACNTAAGEAQNAEALSGLGKAFFYAGARSLLVSHWYVDSQATVTLITKAFEGLKRDPKIGRAGALQQAMLSLINEGKRTWHPTYWAPFVVVGEGAE